MDVLRKQIVIIAALQVMVLSVTGCGMQDPITAIPETPPEENSSELHAGMIDDAWIPILLEVYASVMDETYGAQCDWTTPSFTDDLASYYAVENMRSIDEVEQYLKQYLSDSLIDRTMLENDFLEKDGMLYAVRGGRGYGYYGIDPAVWERTGDSSVNVLFKILDEPQEGKQASFTFVHTADGWKIDTAVLPV